MAIGNLFVVDQDFCRFPIMDEVEELEELIDLRRSESSLVTNPFAFPFFFISGIFFGQLDSSFIIGRDLVTKDERNFEGFGLGARIENVSQFLFLVLIIFHFSLDI